MVRNIEFLAYISRNPGSNARSVAEFFNISPNRANGALIRWWKYAALKRLYEAEKGITYYITKWGNKYLHDQWVNKMGDASTPSHYNAAASKTKQDFVSALYKRKKEPPMKDEEGRYFYVATLEKREGGGFVSMFHLYNNTPWSDVSDWILGRYGPGEYVVSYSDCSHNLDVK